MDQISELSFCQEIGALQEHYPELRLIYVCPVNITLLLWFRVEFLPGNRSTARALS